MKQPLGSGGRFSGYQAHTIIAMTLFVVGGKGLAFLREAFVASALGASAASDGYYLALAMPTLIYSLVALPFSMWVTARLAALRGAHAFPQAASFYARSLLLTVVVGTLLALGLAGTAGVVVPLFAPGLEGSRLTQAILLSRVGALALPALGMQAVCNGRLFADGRFLTVYVWLVISGVAGVGVVALGTPHYGAAAAVWAFVIAAWVSIAGPILARHSGSDHPDVKDLEWADDLGVSMVYRAVVVQIYLQASALLVYGFGSLLPPGELSASLFGSKVQNAIYETLAVTSGVLVYPRIAHLLQTGDYAGVRKTIMQALNWLLPVTAGLVVLLISCRSEIVALVYQRRAFDAQATRLVASALLGYAPGIVGLTLVEIFNRSMVLRGRLAGYSLVFGAALGVTWACNHFLVPIWGVLGLTLSSSAGVLAAGIGLVVYASRRLEAAKDRQMPLLVLRTAAAAVVTFGVLEALRSVIGVGASSLGRLVTVGTSGVAVAAILAASLLALGYRWQTSPQ
jgi:putative peptidoglycan lipid II flippase